MNTKNLYLAPLVFALLFFGSCSSIPNSLGASTPNFYPIKQDEKWGYMNRNGEVVIQPQFGTVSPFSEGLAAVSTGTKWGYIDSGGSYVINPQFDVARPFSEGLALVGINSSDGKEVRVGFIDKTGKYVINPQFSNASHFSEGLTPVVVSSKFGFADKTGQIVINPQFDYASNFSEGLAVVKIDKQFCYIDRTGKIVINPQFDFASTFINGLASVKVGDRYGYIDKTGKFVINPQFDYVWSFSDEGLARVITGDKVGFIDKEGKFIITPQFQRYNSGLVFLFYSQTKDGQFPSFSEGLSTFSVGEKDDQKVGFIDRNGKIMINPQFKDATLFIGGLAMVRTDTGLAYIDKEGKFIWREVVKTAPRAEEVAANSAPTPLPANTPANTAANTASTSFSKEYQGKINNNYEIIMTLIRNGSDLSGTVVPKAGGVSVPVRGTIDADWTFNLSEYDDKNNWTGSYVGRIYQGRLEGKWMKPDGSAQRPLDLYEK